MTKFFTSHGEASFIQLFQNENSHNTGTPKCYVGLLRRSQLLSENQISKFLFLRIVQNVSERISKFCPSKISGYTVSIVPYKGLLISFYPPLASSSSLLSFYSPFFFVLQQTVYKVFTVLIIYYLDSSFSSLRNYQASKLSIL